MWAADISLSSDTNLSSEGYFVVSLSTDDPSAVTAELQQSPHADFSGNRDHVVPANGNITITGLPDGRYHFRARVPGSSYSDPIVIDVMHHSMQRAAGFFLVGLVLFLILVCTIVLGNRRSLESDHAG